MHGRHVSHRIQVSVPKFFFLGEPDRHSFLLEGESMRRMLVLFYFGVIPGNILGLFLTLHSGVTPGKCSRTIGYAGCDVLSPQTRGFQGTFKVLARNTR